MRIVIMTTETTGSNKTEIFDADAHDQETKKAYYHLFDDNDVKRMKEYFKVEEDYSILRYIKAHRVAPTTPDHV